MIGFELVKLPPARQAAGLSFSILRQQVVADRFKLKLGCVQSQRGLTAEFYYNAEVFSHGCIARLTEQFDTLLKSSVKTPEAAIGEWNLLSPAARDELLIKFNDTKSDYTKDKCIHHLIEEQA